MFFWSLTHPWSTTFPLYFSRMSWNDLFSNFQTGILALNRASYNSKLNCYHICICTLTSSSTSESILSPYILFSNEVWFSNKAHFLDTCNTLKFSTISWQCITPEFFDQFCCNIPFSWLHFMQVSRLYVFGITWWLPSFNMSLQRCQI